MVNAYAETSCHRCQVSPAAESLTLQTVNCTTHNNLHGLENMATNSNKTLQCGTIANDRPTPMVRRGRNAQFMRTDAASDSLELSTYLHFKTLSAGNGMPITTQMYLPNVRNLLTAQTHTRKQTGTAKGVTVYSLHMTNQMFSKELV